jgi:hypothetical protein
MEAMTGPENKQRQKLDHLEDALVEDVLAASDNSILAEARQDGADPEAVATATRALFEKAVAARGKARLAAAKAAVVAERRRPAAVIPLDPVAARRLLDRAIARDPETAKNLTMAARKGTDASAFSDEEVRGMLEDFQELGALPPPEEPKAET